MDAVTALAGRDLLSEDQQKLIAGFCQRWNCRGFQALLETNMLSEAAFADIAARIREMPRLRDVRKLKLSDEIVGSLPFPFCRSRLCLVIGKRESGGGCSWRVAIADPWDAETIQKTEEMLAGNVEGSAASDVNSSVEWCIGERSDILEAIDSNFPFSSITPHFWQVMSAYQSL